MAAQAMMLLGVLVIVVGIAASIALHEIGHLLPAKRFGVKCTQYMVGFGTTLWSTRRGETEYGVKLIPLGGYVRMLGMFPPKPGQAARASSTGRLGLLVEQARQDAAREVEPQDADRLFYQRSVPQRLVIMLGGPVMNLVIAVVLLTVVVCGFGLPTLTSRVSDVSACIVPVTEGARACRPGDATGPAAAAGLRAGDEILSIGGVRVSSWEDARDTIRRSGGTALPVVVRRDGATRTLSVTPALTQRQKVVDGVEQTHADGTPVLEQVGFLGIMPTSQLRTQPVTEVPGIVGSAVVQIAGVLTHIPQKMAGVARAAFSGAERDPNGPISVVGVTRGAAEVGASEGSAAAPSTFRSKMATWLAMLASLNLALFVFNLIPLLPLDGGHVAGALWEALKRGVARMRRRPDPGPVDIARALPLAYAVAAVLVGMSVLLIYADIVNPARLTG